MPKAVGHKTFLVIGLMISKIGNELLLCGYSFISNLNVLTFFKSFHYATILTGAGHSIISCILKSIPKLMK